LRHGRERTVKEEDLAEEGGLGDLRVGGCELAERHDQVALRRAKELDELIEAFRVAHRDAVLGDAVHRRGRRGGVNGERDLALGLGEELVVDPGAVVLTQRKQTELVLARPVGVEAEAGDLELHGKRGERLALDLAARATANEAQLVGEKGTRRAFSGIRRSQCRLKDNSQSERD